MASDKAVLRMFGETRKDSKSQDTRMEGDNDNAAGFRMHNIGKRPCLPLAQEYIVGESLHIVLEYTRHLSLARRCWNINIGEGNIA